MHSVVLAGACILRLAFLHKSSSCALMLSLLLTFIPSSFSHLLFSIITAKDTVALPNFLVWKVCGKTQFLHSFERIARSNAETVPFRKISTPEN